MTDITNYDATSFATSSDTDSTLCDIGRTNDSNMHSSISFSQSGAGTSMVTWSGVSRQNIAIYNGLALGN